MKPKIDGTQCVYTIVSKKVIDDAFDNAGEGEFAENQRWTSALTHLEGLSPAEPYPLLLGDAASSTGVGWIAMVETIEISGQVTKVHFSGLLGASKPIPLNQLVKASDGQPLSASYIRPYIPCFVQGELETLVLQTLEEGGYDADLNIIDTRTSDDFYAALKAIEESITPKQKAMLIAQAETHGHVLSMRALANVAGYPSHAIANIQYGKLGRKFANEFGVSDLPNQTQALAYDTGEPDDQGHFTWTLREPLVDALYRFGWIAKPNANAGVDTPEPNYERAAAAIEIDADPKCKDISQTTRTALIEARVGQGAYRERLFAVWGAKCAVTGCDLDFALIASHMKPWVDSSNIERLDEYNGLPLTPNLDKLFDHGFVSFMDDGRMLVKPGLSHESLSQLGISVPSKLRLVNPRHLPYLAAHRAKFGF